MPWYRGTTATERTIIDHSWMIGFAPANDPKIAYCVLVEYGGSGGGAAADVVRTALESCIRHGYLKREEAVPATQPSCRRIRWGRHSCRSRIGEWGHSCPPNRFDHSRSLRVRSAGRVRPALTDSGQTRISAPPGKECLPHQDKNVCPTRERMSGPTKDKNASPTTTMSAQPLPKTRESV